MKLVSTEVCVGRRFASSLDWSKSGDEIRN